MKAARMDFGPIMTPTQRRSLIKAAVVMLSIGTALSSPTESARAAPAHAAGGETVIGLGGAFPLGDDGADGAPDPGAPGLRLSDPGAARPFASGVGIPGSPFLDFERANLFTPRVTGLRMGVGSDRGDGPTSGIVDYQGQVGHVRLGTTFNYRTGEGDRLQIGQLEEPVSLAVGMHASLDGFELSYGYFWVENPTGQTPDRRAQAAGLGYHWGQLRLGVSVLDPIGDTRRSMPLTLTGGEDDTRRYSLGGVYSASPGLQLGASVNLDDAKRGDGRGDDNLLLLFGTVVKF
jgi:Gram-negative porin